MKNTLLFLLLPIFTIAQPWETMGPNDLNRMSLAQSNYSEYSTAIDTNGDVYASYCEQSVGRLVYSSYQNGHWTELASHQTWPSTPAESDVVCKNGKVYFVHWDSGFVVEQYINGNFIQVGSSIHASSNNLKPFLDIDTSGMPLLAINDNGIRVFNYNGSIWDSTLAPSMCPGQAYCNLFDFTVSPSGTNFLLSSVGNVIRVSYQAGSNFFLLADSVNYRNGKMEQPLYALLNVDHFETPYVVYYVSSSHANALRFKNNQWELLNKGFQFKKGYIISNITFDRYSNPHILSNGLNNSIIQCWLDGNAWRFIDSTNLPGDNLSFKINFQISTKGKRYFNIADEYTNDLVMYEYTGVNWQLLGTRGITNGLSAKPFYNIEIDQNGVPWVAVVCNKKVSLLSFDGVNWLVQKEFLSAGVGTSNPIIAFDYMIKGDTQVVSYIANNQLVCHNFINNQWQTSAIALPVTAFIENDLDIIDYNNVVICAHFGSFELPKTYRFDGTHLNKLGNDFRGGSMIRLAHNANNESYVAFLDRDSSNRISVMHFNGLDWNYVGARAIFSYAGNYSVEDMDIAVSKTGVLHFLYTDRNSWPPVTRAYKYENATWQILPSLDSLVIGAGLGKILFDDNNNLYAGCVERKTFEPASLNLLKLVGNQWQFEGNQNFSGGGYYNLDFAFHGQMKYALYNARGLYAKALGPVASIPENSKQNKTNPHRVFPNPSNGLFYLESLKSSNEKYIVVDALGRVVTDGRLYRGNSDINLEAFPAGLYIVKFFDGYTLRLIKR